MRDVNSGWAIRYTHANVASFFFIFVYAQFYNIYLNLLFKDISTKSKGIKVTLFYKIIDNFGAKNH